jgi:glycine/D-amino acid oxidase-like deaminating enzyme
MSAFTEAYLKQFIIAAAIALLATAPARSQGLVDPSKVAPEYREAAEKRRAEQIRQRECALKADLDKVLPRDRTDYLNHCLNAMAAKQ